MKELNIDELDEVVGGNSEFPDSYLDYCVGAYYKCQRFSTERKVACINGFRKARGLDVIKYVNYSEYKVIDGNLVLERESRSALIKEFVKEYTRETYQ